MIHAILTKYEIRQLWTFQMLAIAHMYGPKAYSLGICASHKKFYKPCDFCARTLTFQFYHIWAYEDRSQPLTQVSPSVARGDGGGCGWRSVYATRTRCRVPFFSR